MDERCTGIARNGNAGLLDRRKFLALAAAASSRWLVPPATAQTTAVVTRWLNSVMIAVSDMEKSVAFYQKLFGAPVATGDTAIFRVGAGSQFFGLTPVKSGAKPGYLSYGVTVANFDPGRTSKALASLGAAGEITTRDDVPEVWTGDPDNIRIQLQGGGHGHRSGSPGAASPPQPSRTGSALFVLKEFSHVTLANTNGRRTLDFYSKVFGWKEQARQGVQSCLGVGEGLSFVAVNSAADNPKASGRIDHSCVTIDDFDPNDAMNILVQSGLEPVEFPGQLRPLTCRVRLRQRADNGGGATQSLGTPELYFTDPDSIVMQIQDTRYCGGSGRLGQICP